MLNDGTRDRRYHPRSFDELAKDRISLTLRLEELE
jgi:hypothetical protein